MTKIGTLASPALELEVVDGESSVRPVTWSFPSVVPSGQV